MHIRTIGLLAGEGELPVIFTDRAKRRGTSVVALSIRGLAGKELEHHADKMYWFDWSEAAQIPQTLVSEKIRHVVMLGKIKKSVIFKEDGDALRENAKKMLIDLEDKRDYALLKNITRFLRTVGIRVMDATLFLEDLVPAKGILTELIPSKEEMRDVRIGRSVAKALARLDIGQTVCVKDTVVLALEAAEGTNETIQRAGALGRSGMAVVKMARPDQDMRFDVPIIGRETIERLIEARARVLAIEEKKTIILEKDEIVRRADQAGISLIVID